MKQPLQEHTQFIWRPLHQAYQLWCQVHQEAASVHVHHHNYLYCYY